MGGVVSVGAQIFARRPAWAVAPKFAKLIAKQAKSLQIWKSCSESGRSRSKMEKVAHNPMVELRIGNEPRSLGQSPQYSQSIPAR
ncbi:hypothetical protein N782_08890 [Pontibacillus yanchengensis Y32]|uniref:Uncharacterized protein n=1 Tax=Pontibacillus yanchengensis Y32 TaxID=1385514 RepID=A0A0A2TIE4_9BACI|nr:hypothetical protein N782_08890 [Pontibacillus yanchengensis Y32]